MKQLQDIDFRAAYGPVPDGFSRSVQQALHQTKEEPMKKFTLRTAVMAVVTVLVLTAVGLASMQLAVFADVGVAVLAILNAMRTLRYKG